MAEPPPEVRRLVEERAAARAARDFARADDLRGRLQAAGWEVRDGPGGPEVVRASEPVETYARAADVGRGQPGECDFSLCIALYGWPEDVRRLLARLASSGAPPSVEAVVVDLTGAALPSSLAAPEGVTLRLARVGEDLGHAQAWNVAARLAVGRILCFVEPCLEFDRGALRALATALEDPAVGLAGPFGLRQGSGPDFEASEAHDVDALEYLMALRRDDFDRVGEFDRHYHFYRNLDIDYSHQVAAAGLAVRRVDCGPIKRHEHRTWESTPPAERDRLSKKNFNRYLDRWVRGHP